MCAMQSRAPLNASMCAQQTSPGWKGFCKVPVCLALSLRFCVEVERTPPGLFFFFFLLTSNTDTVLYCERIRKVFSPLQDQDSFDFQNKKLHKNFQRSASKQWCPWEMNAVWPSVSRWSRQRLCFCFPEKGLMSADSLCQRENWNILSLAGCCKRWYSVILRIVTSRHKSQDTVEDEWRAVKWTSQGQQ